MANKIQLRRDTASNWASVNPILSQGEPGVELGTNKWKIGNGTSTWNTLEYQGVQLPANSAGYLYNNGSGTLSWSPGGGGGGGGTVTSVNVSGGTTGLTTSGGPITSSGTITLGGILSVANGGNGLNTVPANGQIDIGNGTGFTRTTLTAGSGIAIASGPGSITITATGGGGGGGSPGGTNTQLQYNNNGAFGGITGVTSTGNSVSFSSAGNISIGGGSPGSLLSTNGSGTLFWATPPSTPVRIPITLSSPTLFVNGSAVVEYTPSTGLPKTYVLYGISTVTPAWVRIYTSGTAATADASRGIGIDPTPNSGVIGEVITSTSTLAYMFSPAAIGYTDDPTTIYIRVTNLTADIRPVTFTFTILKLE